MPRIPGKNKEKISFTCDNSNFKNLSDAVSSSEFSSMSEAINKAISFYYENKNKTSVTKEWMVSEEGKEYIKSVMREVNRE
jgi:Arc/MetJ-type ribon-helix-helix transcriptional regulator